MELSQFDQINLVLVFFLLIGLGIGVDGLDLKRIRQNPRGLMLGMALQFFFMPFWAWLLVQIFKPSTHLAFAAIVVATMPGGNLSNFLSLWLQFDLPLSLAMTTISSLASIVFIPLNLFLYIVLPGLSFTDKDTTEITDDNYDMDPSDENATSDVNSDLDDVSKEEDALFIDWAGIGLSAGLVVVAVLLGILIRKKYLDKLKNPSNTERLVTLSEFLASLCGLAQLILAMVRNSQSDVPLWRQQWEIYAVLMLMPLVAFLLSVFLSVLSRLGKPQSVTVGFECAVQNTSLAIPIVALSIADDSLELEAIGIPLVYASFSSFVGIGFGLLFNKIGWKMALLDLDGKDLNERGLISSFYHRYTSICFHKDEDTSSGSDSNKKLESEQNSGIEGNL